MLEQDGINVYVLIASFLVALVLTPIVRALAIRLEIVDRPDPHRKLHGRTVARAGGTAVLWSTLGVCCGAWLLYFLGPLDSDWESVLSLDYGPFVVLLVVMIGIWLLGLADDKWTLRGRQKLLGQALLAGVLVFEHYQIGAVEVLGILWPLGPLSIPASMIWLLATTNAMNLIDGSDGLCPTLGAIICGALGILAALNGHPSEAIIAFSLCGALLGFLVYNFPPASIFLGDSGSLLIGMVTGALAIRCSLKGSTSIAFLAPVAILSLPLLDSTMAIIRRKLTGRSIYATDRAHLHHTLKNRGLSDRGLLVVVALLSLITASGALAGQMRSPGQEYGPEWLAPLSVVLVFGILVVTKAFGYAEMVLLARRGTHFAMSLWQPVKKAEDFAREKTVRLQGTRQWETVWETLVEFAEREQLCKVHMDLNVPWLEEGFHATWDRQRQPDVLERWSSSLPIYANGRIAGRLDVTGCAANGAALGSVANLLELLEDLTPQVELLLEPQTPRPIEPQLPIELETAEEESSENAKLSTVN